MKIKIDKPVIKGMIFAGCSFTWGQGLHYYSNSPSIIEDSPHGYNPGNHGIVHHRFREKMRWTKTVANYFNSFDIVHPYNGGANDQITEYWKNCLLHKNSVNVPAFRPNEIDLTTPINYGDVSCLIFQLTNFARDSIQFNYKESIINCAINATWYPNPLFSKFESWWKEYGKQYLYDDGIKTHNLGRFHVECRKKSITQVKNLLQMCEDNNIKTFIHTWPFDFVEYIEDDPWLKERFITYSYNDKIYKSLEDLIKNNSKLEILNDYEYFDQPPIDGHPSLNCHNIIASNVIQFVKRKI